MELTVDEALQQGITAHKAGKLQDAERLYRAILQVQPNHPDANHNLGVLAVAVGKPLEAMPLFKLALGANPQIEQFWLSYLDVLIRLERFRDVEQILADAQRAGVSSGKLDVIHQQFQQASQSTDNDVRDGIALSETGVQLADKKKNGGNTEGDMQPDSAPSRDQIAGVLGHYQSGNFTEAESLALSLTVEFPAHAFGWKVLGALLTQVGRLEESLEVKQKAVELSPQDPEAHNNLGNSLQYLGKLNEAEASCRRAIALMPDYAEAHSNLGNIQQQLGNLNEAEASCRRAIALMPDYAEGYGNLGVTLQLLGRFDQAETCLKKAIALNPSFAEAYGNLGITLKELGRLDESISAYVLATSLKPHFADAYVNLGHVLQGVRFNRPNPDLYPALMNLITAGNFVRPDTVAEAICSLLKQDSRIKNLLLIFKTDIEAVNPAELIAIFEELPLLHQFMRICPLPDLQLEQLLTATRRLLLNNLAEIEVSAQLIYFLSTLSLHCFTNEYVYFETADETLRVEALAADMAQVFGRGGQPLLKDILCLATYRPLHRYAWRDRLELLDEVPEVRVRLIDEPVAEIALADNVSCLTEVANETSRAVKAQYEENPYPRWVKLGLPLKPRSMEQFFSEAELELTYEGIKSVSCPSILVAGCGTGQHSITTAARFLNSRVLAIDLSRSSLAYAQRKSNELGIANVEYGQADILALDHLHQTFDVIETAGVLHHMEDPMAGWEVLTGLLNFGGLMKIGLYSDFARRHIASVRREIRSLGIGESEKEIRAFRRYIAESRDHQHRQIVNTTDFFALSNLRDLIFHVQEHRFTLLQIKECIDHLGLRFCGFADLEIVAKFKKFFGEDSNVCDLSLWNQFEERNPDTFVTMYQFWCQKI